MKHEVDPQQLNCSLSARTLGFATSGHVGNGLRVWRFLTSEVWVSGLMCVLSWFGERVRVIGFRVHGFGHRLS